MLYLTWRTCSFFAGTRTGNALTYAADVLLRIGNRPAAKDIVLLITDGVSQDEVSAPAKRIRDTGAQVTGRVKT